MSMLRGDRTDPRASAATAGRVAEAGHRSSGLAPLTRVFRLASLWILLHAQLAEAGPPPEIHGISVTGNRRTATAYVEQALQVAVGDPFDGDVAALEQRLFNLRLFKTVHIVPRPAADGGVDLEVVVEERWTLLPIPMLASSGGETSGGLVLMESNLFGWGKQLMVGGLLSTRGTTGMVAFADPSVAGSRWTFNGAFLRQDAKRERYDGDDEVYAYRDQRYDLSASVGRRVTDQLSASLGWFDLLVDASADGEYVAPARVSPARGLLATLELKGDDFHLFYSSGLSARIQYRQAFSWLASARELRQLEARGLWSRRNDLGHTWSIALEAQGVEGDAEVDALRLGGRPGSRGFPAGGLWAERAATAALEYQVPIWRPAWGVATGLVLLDGGVARWRGAETRYVSPGVGVRLYVADIALPALGFDVATSSTIGKAVVSVTVGFQK